MKYELVSATGRIMATGSICECWKALIEIFSGETAMIALARADVIIRRASTC